MGEPGGVVGELAGHGQGDHVVVGDAGADQDGGVVAVDQNVGDVLTG